MDHTFQDSLLDRLREDRIVVGSWDGDDQRISVPYKLSIACVCEELKVVKRSGHTLDESSAWMGQYLLVTNKGTIARPGEHAVYERKALGQPAFIAHIVDAGLVSAPYSPPSRISAERYNIHIHITTNDSVDCGSFSGGGGELF
jgi:hypothetical protein